MVEMDGLNEENTPANDQPLDSDESDVIRSDNNNKPFSPEAEVFFRRFIENFTVEWIKQAERLGRDDEIIIVHHLKRALDIIQSTGRTPLQQMGSQIGGALIGVAGSGIIYELAKTDLNKPLLVIFLLAGIIGVYLLTRTAYEQMYR